MSHLHDVIAIEREAGRLAALHGTTTTYELDRQARQRGHPGWEAYLDAQHALVRAAITLRDEWLRPATAADGEIGAWETVPAYNPIADEALPDDPKAREDRIATLVSLLIWTSGPWGGQEPGTVPVALEMGCALIEHERNEARREGRRPNLAGCERFIAAVERRVEKLGARSRARRIEGDAWPRAFEEAEAAVADVTPRLAAGCRRMAELHRSGTFDHIGTYGAVYSTFRRFRMPGIAALAA